MPPMPTSTTGTANAATTRKDGRMPPLKMVNARPFVVSSVSTKRYAPAKKPMVSKIPVLPPASTRERSSAPRASRPGSLPPVVPKAEPRGGFHKPLPIPAPNKTTKVQRSPPLPLVPSAGRSLHEKTFAPRPLKIVQRLREGKLLGGCSTPAPVTWRSTQVTIADELPPRPSCVPRARIYVGVSEGTRDVTVKVSTAGPRGPGISRQKPSVNVAIVKVAETSVDSPVVAGGCRAGTLTRNRRLTGPIVYPQVSEPIPSVAWSASSSPELSFSSQSWMVVVDAEVQRIKTPTTTICGDESSSSGDTPKAVVARTPIDSCEESEVVSSPLSLSPSSTVIETLESPAKCTVGSDGDIAMISSPTNVLSAEFSPTVSAATIVSLSRNGTTSMNSLVKVKDKSLASSPTQVLSDAEHRARMPVQCAIEIARPFSPSRRAAQSCIETIAPKSNVSRIRKLFTPQLDEDMLKVSKNPVTQMEIELLRAQKKVAGGGVVDPRLDCLGSLTAMAIARKRLGMFGPESPSQV